MAAVGVTAESDSSTSSASAAAAAAAMMVMTMTLLCVWSGCISIVGRPTGCGRVGGCAQRHSNERSAMQRRGWWSYRAAGHTRWQFIAGGD